MAEKDPFLGLKLLGAKDVQKLTGVSRGTIQAIIRDKIIPAQKTSAGWIFTKPEVEKYQKLREQKSAAGDRRIHLKKAAKKS